MNSWKSSAAKIYLQKLASSLRSEANYIEENITRDGVHTSEEEFSLFLEHGLGYNEEDIKSIIEGLEENKIYTELKS